MVDYNAYPEQPERETPVEEDKSYQKASEAILTVCLGLTDTKKRLKPRRPSAAGGDQYVSLKANNYENGPGWDFVLITNWYERPDPRGIEVADLISTIRLSQHFPGTPMAYQQQYDIYALDGKYRIYQSSLLYDSAAPETQTIYRFNNLAISEYNDIVGLYDYVTEADKIEG